MENRDPGTFYTAPTGRTKQDQLSLRLRDVALESAESVSRPISLGLRANSYQTTVAETTKDTSRYREPALALLSLG
jgi:hypothetical protein